MIVWVLLMGCGSDPTPCLAGYVRSDEGYCERVIEQPKDSDSEDTAEEEDTGEEPDPLPESCQVAAGYSGEAVGSVDCNGGVCEVPAGSFWMGSDEGLLDECPPREIQLSAFGIDATEVTRSAYSDCVSQGGCEAVPSHCDDLFREWGEGNDTRDPDLAPAICITWQQAADYCDWTGGRLPTEAEWEKAARGEQGAVWAWGHSPPDCQAANFRFVSWYCQESVIEVASYLDYVSAYGLWDTVGNAWEWVADFYDAGWYEDAGSTDPQGPEACRDQVGGGMEDCTDKVIRGGAFNTTENTTRGSARAFTGPDTIDNNLSFRCAYDR